MKVNGQNLVPRVEVKLTARAYLILLYPGVVALTALISAADVLTTGSPMSAVVLVLQFAIFPMVMAEVRQMIEAITNTNAKDLCEKAFVLGQKHPIGGGNVAVAGSPQEKE